MSDITAFHNTHCGTNSIYIKLKYIFLDIVYKSDFIFSTPNSNTPIFQREEDKYDGNSTVSNNSWWIQFDSDGENRVDLSRVSLSGRNYSLYYYNYSTGTFISITLTPDDHSILYSDIIEMIESLDDDDFDNEMINIEPHILTCKPYNSLSFLVNSKQYYK
jgi:hypothetical protein